MTEYLVKAVTAFDGVRPGDESWVPATPRITAIIARGYLKLLEQREEVADDGTGDTGPVGPEEGGDTGKPRRASRRVKAGGEQGEDLDAS